MNTIPELPVEPIPGKKRWGRQVYRFTAPWVYKYRDTGAYLYVEVVIPSWFEFDYASIPWPLHYVLRPNGKWGRAAAVHDYLCERGTHRFFTDAVFRHVMTVDRVRWYCRIPFYYAVRVYSTLRCLWR